MTLSGDEGKFIIVKYAFISSNKQINERKKHKTTEGKIFHLSCKKKEENVVKNLMRKLTKKIHTHGGGATKVEASHKQSMWKILKFTH